MIVTVKKCDHNNYILKEALVSFKIKPSSSSSKGTYSFLSNKMEGKILSSRLTRCTCNLSIKFLFKKRNLKYSFCIKCSFIYVKKKKNQPSLIFILLQRTLWCNWWQLLLIWHISITCPDHVPGIECSRYICRR